MPDDWLRNDINWGSIDAACRDAFGLSENPRNAASGLGSGRVTGQPRQSIVQEVQTGPRARLRRGNLGKGQGRPSKNRALVAELMPAGEWMQTRDES